MMSEYVEFVGEELEEIERKVNLMAEGLRSEKKYHITPEKLLIGKLGEESIKNRLLKLVSNVDYEVYPENKGDGGIDFFVIPDPRIGLQIKTCTPRRVAPQGNLAIQSDREEDCVELDGSFHENEYIWYVKINDLRSSHIFIFTSLTELRDEFACIEILGFIPSDILLDAITEEFRQDPYNFLRPIEVSLSDISVYLERFWMLEGVDYFMAFDAEQTMRQVSKSLGGF